MVPPDATRLRLMQGIAQAVAAARPELLNGDACQTTSGTGCEDVDALGPFWRGRLWFAGDRLAAWGWARLPYRLPRGDGTFRTVPAANLTWRAQPDQSPLLTGILYWHDEAAGGADRPREVGAVQRGHLGRSARSEPAEWLTLSDGRRRPGAGAASAHLAAWPSSPLDEAAFERVRRTRPYRSALHALNAAPDGTLAATAIMWLDEAKRTAEFESVGTHRDFRRRGLGRALRLQGMRPARAACATRVFAACRGASAHPAARSMFYGVALRTLTRDLPQIKTARRI